MSLYNRSYEHDSCGIGFVADIKGRPSHDILKRGLEVLARMEHRGAESADNKTGDGSGVLLQIPDVYYRSLVPGLPEKGQYGTGLVFNSRGGAEALSKIEKFANESNLEIITWREIKVESNTAGPMARAAEPEINQIFLRASAPPRENIDFESRLYILRKKIEKNLEGVYLPSLSSRTIVYKGMLTPKQLPDYFPELNDLKMETAVALVHSRFSTNTFPDWPLAQPFRMVAHNGEINTIKGNRFWMAAREADFDEAYRPIIQEGMSDSASFDNALEFLVMACGKTLPQALMMLIPESWNDRNPIPQELKDFYAFHACLMEPWDGPASMVFCDGRYVGGTLDRNGLRPSRYTVTKNGLIIMASETGVQDIPPEDVEYKGRLTPGKLLLVDLKEGRIIPDEEVKKQIALAKPYSDWIAKNLITLEQGKISSKEQVAGSNGKTNNSEPATCYPLLATSFGYTREDIDRIIIPMAQNAQEPISSMGTDTPLAVLSEKPQRVFNYFKQMFAQVTNPPIDSIREDLVMTLTSFVGPRKGLADETEDVCKRIKVLTPILTDSELAALLEIKGFSNKTIDITFEISSREQVAGSICALEKAVDTVVYEAIEAVKSGVSLLVLSDRKAADLLPATCYPLPSLLAVGAVHHALIEAGLRTKASIIIDSAEPREIMHFALLFGYGADLIVPYGALSVIRERGIEDGEAHYIKALSKAMLKIMSKMGTSTIRSYRGSQLFEALGLGQEVIDKCFKGTASRIGGAGFAELEEEISSKEQVVSSKEKIISSELTPYSSLLTTYKDVGQYRWRKHGEKHAWNPETIYLLQWATRTADYDKFKQFTAAINTLNQSPHVIRGLLDFQPLRAFAPLREPIPIADVEPIEAIMKRFTTGAMSFGSISKEAHETIAEAMNSINGRSNSGEGGEAPERFERLSDGRWLRSAIKQIASGRFGVTSEYLANAIELQIKIAQGAKPGEGGQLPGPKVDAMIARTRHSTAGVTLISPPPHHDIYSIEDLAELIFDLKNANPEARISVKLVSEVGVGTIAAGVAKAHADNILISGYDGGTGASPLSSIRHAGIPWELGLSETHQTLVQNGLRGRVRLQTDGQLKTGRDIVIAGMLGAEEFGFGTAALVVMGCVMMRKCHENTCPMGVATQDPELRKRFAGKAEYLVNYFRFLAEEVREIMAELGIRKFDDLVGRTEYLVQRQVGSRKEEVGRENEESGNKKLPTSYFLLPTLLPTLKVSKIDLSAILHKEEGPDYIAGGKDLFCTQNQVHKIDNVLDKALLEKCLPSFENKAPVAIQLPVKNTDRAVGAMLSYEVSKRFGGAGIPDNFITADFAGSAGQSFGAFLAKGITFRLAGDTNDYLGKGLSGGRLVLTPPQGSSFKTNENIITGNTALYGATSGEAFVAGIAGERFCVRNSGVTAVVEGAGDHCAEYMTGGRLIVLGPVGRNFAAGMSGGIAYIYWPKSADPNALPFNYFMNQGMIELSELDYEDDEEFVKSWISRHVYWTNSVYAKSILDNWAEAKKDFIKALPVEYKRATQLQKLAEIDRKLYEIREREGLETKV
ncbi:MAG: glutamate synthase large subunit [Spirochaetaceae bacterium]|jgi:glutamate synthase (NADPH/NADH) large chain|nr:glutamate synthase large subunit [Spirochaetaceae bacterium]